MLGTWFAATATAQVPGGIQADLELWYRADRGVVPVGSEVSVWQDQSGNGRDAAGADRPDLVAANPEVGGLPTVRFEDDALGFDGSFLVGSDYTVLVVAGRRGSAPGNFWVGSDVTTPNTGFVAGWETETLLRLSQYGNDLDAAVPPTGPGREWNLVAFVLDRSDGHRIVRDGTTVASNTDRTGIASLDGAVLGAFPSYGLRYDGDLAEVVMYDRALSCSERVAVEAELADRWGLAWAGESDADADLVCDDADLCPGLDDRLDADGDQVPACLGDCDDGVATVFPGAPEIPDDGVDQDCSGTDTVTCRLDADRDGYGTDTEVLADDGSCDGAASEATVGGDCDDTDPTVHEDCDGDTGAGSGPDADPDPDPDTATDPVPRSAPDGVSRREVGCGCRSGGGSPWLPALWLLLRRRRVRAGAEPGPVLRWREEVS